VVAIAAVRRGVPAAPAPAIVIGEATAAATGAALAVPESHRRTSLILAR
jgi:hypothetical protein